MTAAPEPHSTLGFVIPAYNEESTVGRCVTSIQHHCPAGLLAEILVVDNASTDQTAAIARQHGAGVIRSDAATIGAVRNEGVTHLSSEFVVFLDADCVLTPRWGEAVGPVLRRLRELPLACAGAQVSPPSSDRVFLWTHWFGPFVRQESASHIGSANMICSRETLLRVGGFDERLETGEDFDLCERLRGEGGVILNLPELEVEHYGFPRTWTAFLRRERWHGRGDVTSVRAFLASKVAVVSVSFFAALAAGIVATAGGWTVAGMAAFGAALVLLVGSSVRKFGHAGPVAMAASLLVLPVYFAGRSLAALDALMGRRGPRSPPGD